MRCGRSSASTSRGFAGSGGGRSTLLDSFVLDWTDVGLDAGVKAGAGAFSVALFSFSASDVKGILHRYALVEFDVPFDCHTSFPWPVNAMSAALDTGSHSTAFHRMCTKLSSILETDPNLCAIFCEVGFLSCRKFKWCLAVKRASECPVLQPSRGKDRFSPLILW